MNIIVFLLAFLLKLSVTLAQENSSATIEVEPLESKKIKKPSPLNFLPAKIEGGLGLATIYLPDFPGAKETRLRFLPFPYFIYRGEVIKADRDGGIRSRFFRREQAEIDLSLSGSLPISSRDNEARKGMPELDWLGEIGPRLVYYVLKKGPQSFTLNLPFRAVFSTDFQELRHRGYIFEPRLAYRYRGFIFDKAFVGASLGMSWASQDLMDYFYTVKPKYATSKRPEYKSDGGLLATNTSLIAGFALSDQWLLFNALSFNFYNEAENKNSPLHEDDFTQSVFVGVVYKFYESAERLRFGGS